MSGLILGIQKLQNDSFEQLRGKNIGLICNQASVSLTGGRLENTYEILLGNQDKYNYKLKSIFGPQHGFFAETQDNMIEWRSYYSQKLGLHLHSLYGEHRKPTPEMLSGLDTLVFDLQDVGARYYTFIWTMLHCMEACAENGLEFIVLDRPNPLGGKDIEGIILEEDYHSFVGMAPITNRHGMTVGELAQMFKDINKLDLDLTVIKMDGWKRDNFYNDIPGTHRWLYPSPNMPGFDTAVVYPGGCLLEATNISEGRGTTNPFILIGAPFMDADYVSSELNKIYGSSITAAPLKFIPTFHKFANQAVNGLYLYVTDYKRFRSLYFFIDFLHLVAGSCDDFAWKEPPYEYEYDKMPIDILFGGSILREHILGNPDIIKGNMEHDELVFSEIRTPYLIY